MLEAAENKDCDLSLKYSCRFTFENEYTFMTKEDAM